jgi:hypothetical protein
VVLNLQVMLLGRYTFVVCSYLQYICHSYCFMCFISNVNTIYRPMFHLFDQFPFSRRSVEV